jgi:Right handed beta helix region
MICPSLTLVISLFVFAAHHLFLIGAGQQKVFSVTTYGAKGDGVTDDGPSIAQAISAAIAVGGQVAFPCGEFSLQSVTGAAPAERSLLYFRGARNLQLVGQGHCSHLVTTIPQKSVLEFEDSTGISIASLRITALNVHFVEKYGMEGGSAVRFSGVNKGNISHLEVDGAAGAALYLTKGAANISVSNNFVHDTYAAAVWEDDCGAANDRNCEPSLPPSHNIFESNTFTNTSLDLGTALVLDDGGGSSYAIIRGNTISWNRQAVPGNTNPGIHCIQINNTSWATVAHNNCVGTPWDGIAVTTGPTGKSVGVTIDSNTIENPGTGPKGGAGIVVYNDAQGRGISNFAITSNTITGAADDGIRVVSASTPGTVQNGLVENNTIRNVDQRSPGKGYGISIRNAANITVSSNYIACNGRCIAAGVEVRSSTGVSPAADANRVLNILGPPLSIR